MLAADARRAVEESLIRGSSTPCTWRPDRDAYIAEESHELLAALIEPVAATVTTRANDPGKKGLAEYEDAFAVARSGESWLLYMPDAGNFALAWGEHPGALGALGFSSSDALAEWLG